MKTNFSPQTKKKHRVLPYLVAFLIVGGFVRLAPVLSINFPLNDGGMFFSIIEDLGSSDQIIPSFISYNQEQIPFAYPPMAFYLTGLVSDLGGIPLLNLIRIAPALISTVSLPVFYLLAKNLLKTKRKALAAAAAYVFMPTAFDGLIVGGGLTRSPAWLFSLGTLYFGEKLFRKQQKRDMVLTALLAALTILTHPGVAWFTLYSTGVMFFFRGKKSTTGLLQTSVVAALAALFSAAWWLPTILKHGITIYGRPFQTVNYSFSAFLLPFTFLFTNEPFLDILAWIGLIGTILAIRDREYYLVGWAAAVFLMDPRLSPMYVSVPFALLVGKGFDQGLVPLFRDPGSRGRSGAAAHQPRQQLLLGVFSVFLCFYLTAAAFLAPDYQHLNEIQLQSLKWVEEHTPSGSNFIVLTGSPAYGTDYVSEWFPALASRRSLATPQGAEWLPGQEFMERVSSHQELQTCARKGLACLESWEEARGEASGYVYGYVYLSKKSLREEGIPAELMLRELTDSEQYLKIYENQAAVIFRRASEENER
jgi:hypothetical protein